MVPELPSADYSGIKRRILRSDLSPYIELRNSSESIVVAIDSTGVKVHRAGGWLERKHGKKKRYVKIHFVVNVETNEVVAMEVTTDDVHDSKIDRYPFGIMDRSQYLRPVILITTYVKAANNPKPRNTSNAVSAAAAKPSEPTNRTPYLYHGDRIGGSGRSGQKRFGILC